MSNKVYPPQAGGPAFGGARGDQAISNDEVDSLVKRQRTSLSSFRRKPESRRSKHSWTPACAGVTAFYERIKFHGFGFFLRPSSFAIGPARYARKRIC